MRSSYCSRCADVTLHDKDMCTKCGKTKGWVVSDDIPIKCPCCSAYFFYPSGHPIHSRHQLSLPLPPIVEPKFCDACGDYEVHSDGKCVRCLARTSHPEVSDDLP